MRTRQQKRRDNWWIIYACVLGFIVCALASQLWGADIVLKIGDQPGDVGYRDGDVVNVYTAADISRMWDEIDARGDAGLWVGCVP